MLKDRDPTRHPCGNFIHLPVGQALTHTSLRAMTTKPICIRPDKLLPGSRGSWAMVVGGPEAISVTRAHVTQHQSAHISHAKGSYSMLPPMPPRPDTSSQGQACPPSCLQLQPAALDGAQSTSVRADLAVAGGGTKDRPRCCHLAQEVTATTGSAQEPTTGDCLPVLDWQKWVLGVKQLTYGAWRAGAPGDGVSTWRPQQPRHFRQH